MNGRRGFIGARLRQIAGGNRLVGGITILIGIAMGTFVNFIDNDDEQWVRLVFFGIAILCVCFGILVVISNTKHLLSLKHFEVIVDEEGGDRFQNNQLLNGLGETLFAGIVLCGIGGGILLMPEVYRESLEGAALYFPFLEHIIFAAGLLAFVAFLVILIKWLAFRKMNRKRIDEQGFTEEIVDKQMILEQIDAQLGEVFQVAPVDKKAFKKFLEDVSYVVSEKWLIINEPSNIVAVAASEVRRVDYVGKDRMGGLARIFGAVNPGSGQSARKIGLFVGDDVDVFENSFSIVDGEISQKHHVVCVDFGAGYFYLPAKDEATAREIEVAFYRVMPGTEVKYNHDETADLLSIEQQRWMNVGGVLTAMNFEFVNRLKTGRPIKENRVMMKEWWGISNRQTALDALESLVNTGHRKSFDERLNRDQFRADLVDFGIVSEREDLDSISTLAWDMGRLVNVARWCFDLGYTSEGEAWKYIETAYREVQGIYVSWREFATGYLIGRALWSEMERDVVRIVAGLLEDKDSPWVVFGW